MIACILGIKLFSSYALEIHILGFFCLFEHIVKEKIGCHFFPAFKVKFYAISGSLQCFQREIEDNMIFHSCLAFLIIFVIIFNRFATEEYCFRKRNFSCKFLVFKFTLYVLVFSLLAFTSIYIKYSLKESIIFVYPEPMYTETVQLCRLMSNYSLKLASK